MEKEIFFFSGYFPLSVAILGWSNACGVSGNSAWHSLGQVFLPVLDMIALKLTLVNSRRFAEGGEAWKNGEIYGNRGKKGRAKGNHRITYQDVAVSCCMPDGQCR